MTYTEFVQMQKEAGMEKLSAFMPRVVKRFNRMFHGGANQLAQLKTHRMFNRINRHSGRTIGGHYTPKGLRATPSAEPRRYLPSPEDMARGRSRQGNLSRAMTTIGPNAPAAPTTGRASASARFSGYLRAPDPNAPRISYYDYDGRLISRPYEDFNF